MFSLEQVGAGGKVAFGVPSASDGGGAPKGRSSTPLPQHLLGEANGY